MKSRGKRPLGRPPVQEEGIPTPQLIKNISSKLFMEKGFESVSMNEVAKQSGVTKATVYYYFPTKNDLFLAAIGDVLGRVTLLIENILCQEGSFYYRLTQVAEQYLKVPKMHMHTMLEKAQQYLSEEQAATLNNYEQQLYEHLQNWFIEANEKHEIDCEDPILAAHLYVSMLRVTESKYWSERNVGRTEDAAKVIVSLLWRGIQPQNSEK
ncbi:TetR/AcrR family transcriptional regulator [Paenibacillus turicensis]|uniref:TetR/AcrR family transcriptional regulator n=1 Tax=Paenibacillus turicensis TaxID=160487 RepID=UPI003D26AA1D